MAAVSLRLPLEACAGLTARRQCKALGPERWVGHASRSVDSKCRKLYVFPTYSLAAWFPLQCAPRLAVGRSPFQHKPRQTDGRCLRPRVTCSIVGEAVPVAAQIVELSSCLHRTVDPLWASSTNAAFQWSLAVIGPLAELSPSDASLLAGILGPFLSIFNVLFILRIVMSWYPQVTVLTFRSSTLVSKQSCVRAVQLE